MQVVLQGSLRHFAAAELLTFLCSRGRSGTLDAESTGRKARILFENDRIVWAESSRGGDAAEAVLELFEWAAGTFTLLDSAVLPDGAQPLALALPALLEEARRRAERGGGYSDATMFRVVDDPALQQQVSLTADAFKLLFRVAAGKTFRELVSELGAPRHELAERLKSLEQLGLVTVVHDEPQAEVTAPQTAVQRRTVSRKRTLVGSLTPDTAPDSVWPLLDAEYSIGRAPDNAITIADASVSSHHARVTRTAEGFFLEDLQSRNGTFVNGEKVDARRQLADGDLLRLGKVILTFNIARESKLGDTTAQSEVRLV